MAVPQFSDEVQIVLTAIDPPDPPCSPPLGDRYLLLTKENPTVPIGRTSKRDAKLEPARNNAWIDSAVMSRNHAILHFDVDQKKVFIKDIGSLHGTFRNGLRLVGNKLQALEQGDMLRFGIAVERSMQAFPPCTMRILINHGTETRPESKSVVFWVPDDTDVEDIISDDDFSIRTSTRILRENGFHPGQPHDSSKAPAIDLTSEEEDNEFNFSDLHVIEGQRVEPGEWESCSSVVSPAASAVLAPKAMNSAVTTPAETSAKGPAPVLDGGEEADGNESVDLDGALGFDLATENLPADLPSLTVGCDDVGLEGPKTMAEQEVVVARDSVPPTQHWVEPDSTVMFSSPTAHPTRGLEMQPPRDSLPVFDETSAYQFELSKKAVAATARGSEQTHIEARTCAERSSGVQSSHKRKAEDISELTPEERFEIELREKQARTSPSQVICSAHASSWKALVNEAAENSRATKRLRRAAEVFGYAAIGGVAVMSALIATAPAL